MPSVRATGVEIHYEVSGAGPALLLAHSLLCSGEMWRSQVPALARGHRVVNVDARGHGASGRATSGFTLYDSLSDHLAVLDALGIERAVWVGLSQGGMVALRAALTAPRAGRRPRPRRHRRRPRDARDAAQGRAARRIARTVGVRPVLPQIAKLMFGSTTRRENPALVAEWSARFAALDVASVLHALGAVSRRDDLLPARRPISRRRS